MATIPAVTPKLFAPNRFDGQVLIVTGAAIGSIGGCVAVRAAKEGAAVVCVDRKVDEVEQTVQLIKSLGGKASKLIADVSIGADADRMVNEAVRQYGKLDLALNAAGVMDGTDPAAPADFKTQLGLLPSRIHTASDEYWNNVFATNATGVFYSMRAELRQFLKQQSLGSIVNIGSIAGLTGLPGNPAYVASKHAVIGLTRNAAIDYAPHGIRINSVNMAQTDTPMVSRAYEFVKWAQSQQLGNSMAGAKSQSLLQIGDENHRGSTPWEQAAIILFLLSSEASNLTGMAMATDGGWTAY
jgi:NAD(P)-dependent dehydrogenase (short-subunit alcohol dehydrogenase family)